MTSKSKNIGEMNGGWKLLFKTALAAFPVLCAVVGYGAIVLREHDQRIVSMESVQRDRQMLIDEFRKMRDELPVAIKELSARVEDLRINNAETKQSIAELRKLIIDLQLNKP